jgi:hypothetical protein
MIKNGTARGFSARFSRIDQGTEQQAWHYRACGTGNLASALQLLKLTVD